MNHVGLGRSEEWGILQFKETSNWFRKLEKDLQFKDNLYKCKWLGGGGQENIYRKKLIILTLKKNVGGKGGRDWGNEGFEDGESKEED